MFTQKTPTTMKTSVNNLDHHTALTLIQFKDNLRQSFVIKSKHCPLILPVSLKRVCVCVCV